MKRISELIKELESLKEQHGDLPVAIDHSDYRPTLEETVEIFFSPKSAKVSSGTECVDAIIIM